MADNKKYYYLKLKENFYDSEEMIILQNMPDGYLYSDILLKLYLRSLKNGGKLMFKDVIPYTPQILAQVVRHQVGTVEKALKIFQDLGLIEVLDNGAIYVLSIQSFIGESSTEADRIRSYRTKIKQEELRCTNVQQLYDKSTPEIEIELEKEIEIDEIVKCYQENIGTLNPASAELLFTYKDDFNDEMIIEAIKIAGQRNAHNVKYICGILNDWKKKNYKTKADVKNEKKTNNIDTEMEDLYEN